ncbi:MAG: aldo/keto reductase [Halioglobus sp.]
MLNRRQLVQLGASMAAIPALSFSPAGLSATGLANPGIIRRKIPSSGEALPVIGMGTSRTFDANDTPENIEQLRQVMHAFLEGGGSVIDSSPMYGNAESRVGDVVRQADKAQAIFAATKVWTNGHEKGVAQIQASAERMAVNQFGLIAVHNLRDWKVHLKTLRQYKDEGVVRHIGITTSHGRFHTELQQIMRTEPLDFVQFSYNIADRTAEKVLLPLAQEHGIATMINRPFQRGELFSATRNKPLPSVAQDVGCTSWAQFFLKFILAHNAVTCIIPASAKPTHMADNMRANLGEVPTLSQRNAMKSAFEALT